MKYIVTTGLHCYNLTTMAQQYSLPSFLLPYAPPPLVPSVDKSSAPFQAHFPSPSPSPSPSPFIPPSQYPVPACNVCGGYGCEHRSPNHIADEVLIFEGDKFVGLEINGKRVPCEKEEDEVVIIEDEVVIIEDEDEDDCFLCPDGGKSHRGSHAAANHYCRVCNKTCGETGYFHTSWEHGKHGAYYSCKLNRF